MVNLVIVSHSAALAAGVRELAQQMVQEEVQIALAGGIDDPEHPIGTDAVKVLEAIQSLPADEGILVLMDLGSALMSAETALEFLEPARRENVRLCPAPLVEGALAAAVQASVGASLDEVFDEAMTSLQAKQRQMPELLEAGAPPVEGPDQQAEAASEIRLTIPNPLGLHARPAARFVATANRFESTIRVRKDQQEANAKSINQVATLGARQGDEILVSATGPDKREALQAIQALAEDNFGDREAEAPAGAEAVAAPAAEPSEEIPGTLQGIGASPGIALGPLVQYRPRIPDAAITNVDDPEAEWVRFQAAVDAALSELESLRQKLEQGGNETEAEIFAAHELILQDPALLDQVKQRIHEQSAGAAGVWQLEIAALADKYRAIEDDYMRARANDVVDVGRRVLAHLLQVEAPSLDLETPSIVAARDLAPSDTARFDPELVLGVCTELGGATSHSAILARALGIPAVVGIGPALQAVPDGQGVAVDGASGTLWLEPDEETTAELQARRTSFLKEQERVRQGAQEQAVTGGGRRIEVAANIGGPQDVALALELGAEGVGLFRTEFLFLDRDEAPTEQEQELVYRQVAQAMGDRPVIIRTLDVGGDKPLPYIELGEEENPFLGWRGIRFCLDNPRVFLPQLRAILRAGSGYNVKLMFPMVSELGELRAAKEMLAQARRELREDDVPFDEHMDVGIMIEVPAAVAIADQLAQEVDFFSIGTNDLTQYVMAADRGNRRVADLAQALQPAVLRMVAQTIEVGHEAGIWVGMCGELAGNALATPLLVGLGLDELSMNAPAIPRVKEAIRAIDDASARTVAQEILRLEDAKSVEKALRELTSAPSS